MTNEPVQLVEDIARNSRAWPQQLKERKAAGAKLVGYTGRFIPEELIFAAGASPFLICRGGEPEPTEASLPYMLRFLNPFVRAQLGYYLLGIDPVIPMLDLSVTQCDDCHMSRLADLFEYLKLPALRLGIPPDWDKDLSVEYYARGLERLKNGLEDLTGNPITDAALNTAIEQVNQIRSVLATLSDLRKATAPALGGYDMIRLHHASFFSEPDEFVTKGEALIESLNAGPPRFDEQAPRILLAGRVVAVGDYVVPRLIEDAGGVIVTEFLDEGVRAADTVVTANGNPMDSLVRHYFTDQTPPSIFQPSWPKRKAALERLIKTYRVDGVVWYQLSFDEIYDMEYPLVSRMMDMHNIPVLKLETSYEYAREATGPLATRVESFLDAIGHQKGGR